MMERTPVSQSKSGEAEQERRTKHQEPQPTFDKFLAWGQGNISIGDTPFLPRMDRHAVSLSNASTDGQRADLALQLQQTYGNRYVQRLIESIGVRTKNSISTPGDINEQEADRVTDEGTGSLASQAKHELDREKSEPVLRKDNNTGMPDTLKAGVEHLSGIDLSDVRVHYNSDKPAQFQASALTQGADIHVAPGEEKHLPHEAWHAVQQKQGRVKPTIRIKETAISDDKALEEEAEAMGAESLRVNISPYSHTQLKSCGDNVTQMQPDDEKEKSPERQDLLELAAELKKTKSSITTVPEDEIDAAVETLRDAARNADNETISEGMNAINEQVEKAEKEPAEAVSKKGTVQMSGWRFLYGAIGALVGVLALGIGAYFGARYGYRRGKKKDVLNKQRKQHNDWRNTQAPAPFTAGNLQFATYSDGNYGSIYFTQGRVRLIHPQHPTPEVHPRPPERFSVNAGDHRRYDRAWHRHPDWTHVDEYAYLTQLHSYQPNTVHWDEHLFEYFDQAHFLHESRGIIRDFNSNFHLNQAQVNLLYYAANNNDNDILRRAMESDAVLAAIPIG